ncbi:MAG: TonB C-terminal domain-containing protein [Deltaproteobacteria bacterium]|nr:TonB C-terminal domain-containing protein [Deltaproteobacteria bacterium]
MSATWDVDEAERRIFRRVLLASLLAHVALLLVLALSPSFSHTPELPAAITVDLLAAPGAPPAAKAAPAAKAPKPAPAPPAAKPEPVPPPPRAEPAPPAVPPPVAKPTPPPPPKAETVLPKEAAKAPEQVKPAPAPAKPAPPQPAAKPAPPQRQASIDDVLSQLRAEAGETEPIEQAALEPADVSGTGGGGGSVRVSPEVMAWLKSARIHVRKSWVLAPGFRLEPLATQVRVNLDAAGNVVGEPAIVRKSGNPWYDESVLRAIQKASPLPAPPRAGEWDFLFQPEES